MSKTKLNFADVYADLGKGELSLLQLVESKVASDNDPHFWREKAKDNYTFYTNIELDKRLRK